MTAPVASGWSGGRVGLAPTEKRRLTTAHTRCSHSRRLSYRKFRNNEGRLRLDPLTRKLANSMWNLALSREVECWSLTTIAAYGILWPHPR
jgi:hypothetical protein